MKGSVKSPGFSVVTLVCVVLGFFGLGLHLLLPMLPPQDANAMRLEADEYLRQGARQQIDWKLLNDRAFAEARRLQRPILLLMGIVGSRDGRLADGYLFTDQDVQSYLERNFVCIRVDLDAQPYWGSAILPVSRNRVGISPSFQIWYLDGEGKVFDFLGRESGVPLTDPVAFLDELARARRTYEQHVNTDGESLQDAEVAIFESIRPTRPNLEQGIERLQGTIDPEYGGFPIGRTQSMRPHAIQALLYAGRLEAARLAIDPALRSGIVDWLDGGFFRRARERDWSNVEFDKLAVANAETMSALATYVQLTGDRFADRVAKNTFETLHGEFSRAGLVATARIGDEDARFRSSRSSFSARDLRAFWGSGLLTPKEAASAREFFGLKVETNPQMVLRVADPEVFGTEPFETILAKLRKNKSVVETRYSRNANAFVNATVTAAMYRVARLWGGRDRLAVADERFRSLTVFGTGSDVSHYAMQRVTDFPYLGDYLAVAEVCLERYLATGDEEAIQRGVAVILRAKTLFEGPYGWKPTIDRAEALVPGTNLPEIVDGNTEALAPRAARLAMAYSRVLRGGDQAKEAAALAESALQLVAYADLFLGFGPLVGGLIRACYDIEEDRYAVTVGPAAVDLAARLSRRAPTHLVMPAGKTARADFARKEIGIYVIEGSTITGPLSVDQAAGQLMAQP